MPVEIFTKDQFEAALPHAAQGGCMIRVNDRVRVIDPRREEFDEKGYVTHIAGARYYVVFDGGGVASLSASQLHKVAA